MTKNSANIPAEISKEEFKAITIWHSLVVQQVKDPMLSLQQLGVLLWHGFDPWPGNLHMPQVWPNKVKQNTVKKKKKSFAWAVFCIKVIKY